MIQLLIGGVDRTSFLKVDSLSVTDALGERNSASFVIEDKGTGYEPPEGAEVIVTNLNTGKRVFGGLIFDTDAETLDESTSARRIDVTCVDFNEIADRHLVAEVYETPGQTAGSIARDVVADQLAADGVTSTGVQDGPEIEKAVFNFQPAATVLNELAELTGYSWNIDYHKVLRFFAQETFTAPFSITDNSYNFRKLKVRKTREQYRNRQYIRAGLEITDPRTETRKGDGQNKAFTMSFDLAMVPTVKVNGVTKTVGIRGLDTGRDFYWAKGEKEITQDDAATPLADGDLVAVTYQGLFPIIIASQDDAQIASRQAIEGGSGLYEAVEDAPEIESSSLAMEKANAYLRKFGRIPRVITFETDNDGLEAGQLLPVNVTAHGLNGQFLIESVTAQSVAGKFMRYQVKALDGEALGGWAWFFRKLVQQGRKFVIRENEVLMLLRRFVEVVTVADSLSFSTSAATVAQVGTAIVGFSEVG